MAIKIDNYFPDIDCIVVDTKKYRVTVYKDDDGETFVAVCDKRSDLDTPFVEYILGKESPK